MYQGLQEMITLIFIMCGYENGYVRCAQYGHIDLLS